MRGWIVLVAASAALTVVLHHSRVPAALLLGPMLAGMAVAARGPAPVVPGWMTTVGQAVVGCLIAGGMAGGLGPAVAAQWGLFLALTAATVATSAALGYALARTGAVPGSVAIWGSMPGGAAAMVLMAEADGADPRLVAVMVYTRVVVVTLSATALAAVLGAQRAPAAAVEAAAAAGWQVAAMAAAGVAAARLLRWPAGTLILTMALGVGAEALGMAPLRVPAPVLALSFAFIGWRVGLSFTGEARGAALRMLPRIAAAAVLLTGFCGVLAAGLHRWAGVDPLTAWLAASPGGLESVAAIAGSLDVDAAFVMAAQSARFALVMLVGPPLALALSRRRRRAAGEAPSR